MIFSFIARLVTLQAALVGHSEDGAPSVLAGVGVEIVVDVLHVLRHQLSRPPGDAEVGWANMIQIDSLTLQGLLKELFAYYTKFNHMLNTRIIMDQESKIFFNPDPPVINKFRNVKNMTRPREEESPL